MLQHRKDGSKLYLEINTTCIKNETEAIIGYVSICRDIIEAHGGELAARHDKATSTLLTTVTFPLAPSEA